MNKIKHISSFEVEQPIQLLFPLFSAEGEKLWVPDWDYENIMGSTELHEDYVFLTKTHDHASTEAIWIVKKYQPVNHYVQFYKVEPNDKIGIIEIKCIKLTDTSTKVQVTYEYIGLSEKGNQFIQDFTALRYKDFIAEWEALLVAYFKSRQ